MRLSSLNPGRKLEFSILSQYSVSPYRICGKAHALDSLLQHPLFLSSNLHTCCYVPPVQTRLYNPSLAFSSVSSLWSKATPTLSYVTCPFGWLLPIGNLPLKHWPIRKTQVGTTCHSVSTASQLVRYSDGSLFSVNLWTALWMLVG